MGFQGALLSSLHIFSSLTRRCRLATRSCFPRTLMSHLTIGLPQRSKRARQGRLSTPTRACQSRKKDHPIHPSHQVRLAVASMLPLRACHVCHSLCVTLPLASYYVCVDVPSAPQVRGYALVDAVPNINAAELAPSQVKQLMTWGSLDATPRIISDDPDAPPLPLHVPSPSSAFQIKPRSAREQLGLRLGNNASKALRVRAAIMNGSTPLGSRTPLNALLGHTPTMTPDGRMSMPPPQLRTPTAREASSALTPAALRLLQRTAGARRADAMNATAGWGTSASAGKKDRDMARVRWTPSPAATRR